MNRGFLSLALSLFTAAAACGSDAPSSQSEDLTAAGKKLIGAYRDQGAGTFQGLVLTADTVTSNANRFFADVKTNIQCVKAPCPSTVRLEGTFTAGTKTITLRSDSAPPEAEQFLGKYNYKVGASGKFSLSRTGFEQSLERVESYCAAESAENDCYAQDLVVPACFPLSFSCSETSSCEFSCGTPPTTSCLFADEEGTYSIFTELGHLEYGEEIELNGESDLTSLQHNQIWAAVNEHFPSDEDTDEQDVFSFFDEDSLITRSIEHPESGRRYTAYEFTSGDTPLATIFREGSDEAIVMTASDQDVDKCTEQ